METVKNSQLSFYSIKRQMGTMFMSIGLLVGLSLILLQLYINQTVIGEAESQNLVAAASQVIQPFTDVISKVLVSLFSQGVL